MQKWGNKSKKRFSKETKRTKSYNNGYKKYSYNKNNFEKKSKFNNSKQFKGKKSFIKNLKIKKPLKHKSDKITKIPYILKPSIMRTPEGKYTFIEYGGIYGGEKCVDNMGIGYICCKADGDRKRPIFIYAYKDMNLFRNIKKRSLIFKMNGSNIELKKNGFEQSGDVIIAAMCKMPLTDKHYGSYSVVVYQCVRNGRNLKLQLRFNHHRKFVGYETNDLIGEHKPSSNLRIIKDLSAKIDMSKNKQFLIHLIDPIYACLDKCMQKYISYTWYRQAPIVAKILKNNLEPGASYY